jgi:hypothetical protein
VHSCFARVCPQCRRWRINAKVWLGYDRANADLLQEHEGCALLESTSKDEGNHGSAMQLFDRSFEMRSLLGEKVAKLIGDVLRLDRTSRVAICEFIHCAAHVP